MHGGRIWAQIDSASQERLTISFTLPSAGAAATESQTDTPGRSNGQMDRLKTATSEGRRTRVLVVDSDHSMLGYVRHCLEDVGYRVAASNDPRRAIEAIQNDQPDIVVMDSNFPRISGLRVLKLIREISTVPVIFLSNEKDENEAVRALREGADDYLTKPFLPEVLAARIEAILRRWAAARRPHNAHRKFTVDDLSIDFEGREVLLHGERVKLTAKEFKLLKELAQNPGRVLTHAQILQRVWGDEYKEEPDLIRGVVRDIRRKLNDSGRRPRYIQTEIGVGYYMKASSQDS
jgi:two-component system KDP operon response regulator KdpE